MQKSIHLLYLMCFPALIFTQVDAQITYEYYKNPDKIGSSNPQATEYFIKSFEFIMQWGTEDTDSAIYYMQKAIEEDSLYAIAYAALGHLIKYKAYDGTTVSVDSIGKLAEKALQINPNVGDALTLQSWICYMDGNYQKAIDVCKKAVKAEPDHRETWLWLAIRYSHIPEKIDSAIIYFEKTIQVDSLFGQPHQKLGWIYIFDKKEYLKAAYHFRRMIHLYEDVEPRDERMILGYAGLGESLLLGKRFDNAIDTFNLLLQKCDKSNLHWVNNLRSWAYSGLIESYMGKANLELNNFIDHNYRAMDKHPDDIGSLHNLVDEIDRLEWSLEEYDHRDTLNKIRFLYYDEILDNANEDYIISSTINSKIRLIQKDKNYPKAQNEIMELLSKYADNKKVKAKLLFLLARNYSYLDNNRKALKYLKLSINEGYNDFTRFKEDPIYIKLKDDPKFKKIESQINQ